MEHLEFQGFALGMLEWVSLRCTAITTIHERHLLQPLSAGNRWRLARVRLEVRGAKQSAIPV